MKIILLVATALIASLGVYLYVATTLITNDKVSYIYDYSLTDVRTIAERVDGRVTSASELCRTMVAVLGPENAQNMIAKLYNSRSAKTGIKQIALYRISSNAPLQKIIESGSSADSMSGMLQAQGWDAAFFRANEFAVGTAAGATIPIGGVGVNADNAPFVYAAVVDLSDILKTVNGAFDIFVADSKGTVLTSKSKNNAAAQNFKELFKEIGAGSFGSGVREWKSSAGARGTYIVGYQQTAAGRVNVVSLIDKKAAFAANALLFKKSVLVGACILLLTLGFALLFIKGLVRRIRELWHATKLVSEGDFSVRVATTDGSKDEVASLADSFNTMSSRITQLMDEVSTQARLEKELETAQVLQTRFFPHTQFEHDNMTIAGRVISATECSGDWWYYSQTGKHLIVVVGDVTGHGVSAALVTAAAQGAFTVMCERYAKSPIPPDPYSILTEMNSAVYVAGGQGEFAEMTFLASVINLETGTMTYANASHRPAWVIHKDGSMNSLMGATCSSLGHGKILKPEVKSAQLLPGDSVLWFTDGLLECTAPDGKPIRRKELVKNLADLGRKNDGNAKAVCDGFVDTTLRFLGGEDQPRADDITVVIASVPSNAVFKKAPLKKAS